MKSCHMAYRWQPVLHQITLSLRVVLFALADVAKDVVCALPLHRASKTLSANASARANMTVVRVLTAGSIVWPTRCRLQLSAHPKIRSLEPVCYARQEYYPLRPLP